MSPALAAENGGVQQLLCRCPASGSGGLLRDARGPSSPSPSCVMTLPEFPQREGEHGPHRGTSPAPLLGLALAVLRAAGAPGTGLFQAVGSSEFSPPGRFPEPWGR